MRKILLAVLITVAAPVAAHAQDAATTVPEPAKLKEAQAIIAVMFPPAEQDQKLHDIMSNMVAQMRGGLLRLEEVGDPGLKAILDRFIDSIPDKLMPTARQHFPAMLDATAQAYTHEFSLEELKQIHAFAETPAGKHYFGKATDLLKDPSVAKANERYFEALRDVQKKEVEGLRKEVMAYLKAHPEVAKKLQAAK